MATSITGSGSPTIYTGTSSGDSLVGGKGNDSISGGGGNDSINGGYGDDILIGGKGDDQLTGGGGADIFRFPGGGSPLSDDQGFGIEGVDTISDLAEGDVIEVWGQVRSVTLTVVGGMTRAEFDIAPAPAALAYDDTKPELVIDLGGGFEDQVFPLYSDSGKSYLTVTPANNAWRSLVSGNSGGVSEGDTATFILSMPGVRAGAAVAYSISGVSSADLGSVPLVIAGNQRMGGVILDAGGRAVISIPIAADSRTEGTETLTVTSGDASASVSISDTSFAPPGKTLAGSSWSETLAGSVGDDTLSGLAGNDTLVGGEGSDLALMRGRFNEYLLSASGVVRFPGVVRVDKWTVTDLIAGRDGSDELQGVERIRFQDLEVNTRTKSLALEIDPQIVQRIIELYVGFFNRVPDGDGLAYWLEQYTLGKSIKQIADSFYQAGVYYSQLTGFSSSMTNADFINVVYRNVLGRSEGADPEGLQYWGRKLADGSASRGSLVSSILDSAHTFKGHGEFGYVADLLDNKILVSQKVAVDWGVTYLSPEDSLQKGMEMARAITASNTSIAISLVGVPLSSGPSHDPGSDGGGGGGGGGDGGGSG